MAEGAMATFLSSIGDFFTQSLTWVGEIMTTITGNAPLTVVVFGFLIVGFAFGLLGRLIKIG